ncbi:hypothetical protein GUJ93_ZPchr0002g24194 [Zizania palustris]|uniref:PUM-HD domain-containing protein n=1 Tax=Zizania palustris TaxID=103762 RepID=A0A8J5VH93_ZIZPA|nr:hypothetical protein GUJ93_ZPchr0002g24194 [Zizania palustris]
MMDQHGNYVIQKVLETAEMWQRDMVVAVVMHHVGMLTMYAPGGTSSRREEGHAAPLRIDVAALLPLLTLYQHQ